MVRELVPPDRPAPLAYAVGAEHSGERKGYVLQMETWERDLREDAK